SSQDGCLNEVVKDTKEKSGWNPGWRGAMPDYARTWGSVLVVVATLYFGRAVLLPVALSILLTVLLSPLVTWLRGKGLPQIVAVVAVSMTALGAALCIGGLVTLQLYDLAKSLPQYRENIQGKIEAISSRSGVVEQI